jgi:hypothetical protein
VLLKIQVFWDVLGLLGPGVEGIRILQNGGNCLPLTLCNIPEDCSLLWIFCSFLLAHSGAFCHTCLDAEVLMACPHDFSVTITFLWSMFVNITQLESIAAVSL